MTQTINPPLLDHPMDGDGVNPMKDNAPWLSAIGLVRIPAMPPRHTDLMPPGIPG